MNTAAPPGVSDHDKIREARFLLLMSLAVGLKSPSTPMSDYRGKGRDQAQEGTREAPLEMQSRQWWEREIRKRGLHPTRIHAVEPDLPHYSTPPNVVMSGSVLRALWTLGPVSQHWLYHHYGYGQRQREATQHLAGRVFASYLNAQEKALRHKTQQVVQWMIAVHIDRSASMRFWDPVCPGNWDAYFDIKAATWEKRYLPHFEAIYGHMKGIDARALVALYDKVYGTGEAAWAREPKSR